MTFWQSHYMGQRASADNKHCAAFSRYFILARCCYHIYVSIEAYQELPGVIYYLILFIIFTISANPGCCCMCREGSHTARRQAGLIQRQASVGTTGQAVALPKPPALPGRPSAVRELLHYRTSLVIQGYQVGSFHITTELSIYSVKFILTKVIKYTSVIHWAHANDLFKCWLIPYIIHARLWVQNKLLYDPRGNKVFAWAAQYTQNIG